MVQFCDDRTPLKEALGDRRRYIQNRVRGSLVFIAATNYNK